MNEMEKELHARLDKLKADALAMCRAHEKAMHKGAFCPKVRVDLLAVLTLALAKDHARQCPED